MNVQVTVYLPGNIFATKIYIIVDVYTLTMAHFWHGCFEYDSKSVDATKQLVDATKRLIPIFHNQI